MESSCVVLNQNSSETNGFKILSPSSYLHEPCIKLVSLPWLDLRIFYVRVSNCEIDDSTPEFLTLNHVPLNRDTLLEVNGARASIYADGVTTLLRRDRLDKRSEEATFVSIDSVKVTGSVKFDVKKSGVGNSKCGMDFESVMVSGSGFFKGSHHPSPQKIEVYVACCSAGSPIVLTKTLQLGPWKKLRRRSLLDTIPEHEATESFKDPPPANLSQQKWEQLCLARLHGRRALVVQCWCASRSWNRAQRLSWTWSGCRIACPNLSRNHSKIPKEVTLGTMPQADRRIKQSFDGI